jgi:hypothetical protein
VSESPRLVRFLVGVQHRPFTSTVAVCAALLFFGWAARWPDTKGAMWAYVVISTCVGMTVAEVGARATILWGRLVVAGLAVGTTLPIAALVFGRANGEELVVATATVTVPIASVSVANRLPGLDRGACVLALTASASAVYFATLPFARSTDAILVIAFVVWSSLIQFSFHAAAASALGLPIVVAGAAVFGAISGFAVSCAIPEYDSTYWLLWIAGAWLVSALLVPLARLGRSFTAVPLDHPIFTDFGGPRRA